MLSMMIFKYYIDPAEKYVLGMLTFSFSLTISLLCILIIPIDIYITSTESSGFSFMDMSLNKKIFSSIQFYLQIILVLNAFIIIPFTYFYGEESDIDFLDFDYDRENKEIQRIWNSVKYTLYFLVCLIFIFIIGLIFRPGQSQKIQQGNEVEWIKQLFDVEHYGESSILFSISILTCGGSLFWIVYASYGLAQLPVNLIKGEKSLTQSRVEVQFLSFYKNHQISNDLISIRQKQRNIQERYISSHSKISASDQKLLNKLRKQEKILSLRNERINFAESNFSNLSYIFVVLRPFSVIIGLICLGFTILIFFGLGITAIDKISHSKCGLSCGFIVEGKQTSLNPIDAIFVFASKYFPLDYIFFFFLILYVFVACLYGIVKLGIKFICFTIYPINKQSSMPQALLLLSFLLTIILLVLWNQLLVLCPQYTTFGAQTFLSEIGGQQKPCTLDAITSAASSQSLCRMSGIAAITNKMSMSIPFFGSLFFFANLAFLCLNFIFFIRAILQKKKNEFDYQFYDLEEAPLIKTI